jgi:aryl-alcohol dehydrogenase-like predicted oxidoreductase
MTETTTRVLGRSGIRVSAMGLGGWAIGGPFTFAGRPAGWGTVDDEESIRAVHAAVDDGITFFDTAANYGAGHSEEVLGRALADRRGDVVIATKFGHDVDERARAVSAYDGDEATSDVAKRLRDDLTASLRRLGTDYIDVYQLHVGALERDRAVEVRDVLEELVAQGRIRTYGWSTNQADAMRDFAGPGCGAVQLALSVLDRQEEYMLPVADELDLGAIVKSPLGMGLLTGKFTPEHTFPADDVRSAVEWHPGFRDGRPDPGYLDRVAAVREVLTSGGRTLAQGALAWVWGRSPRTVPIPGFRTVAQVEENAGALEHGPLTPEQMDEVERILRGDD